jgi:quercetin dioxygenase-like cupin family protein
MRQRLALVVFSAAMVVSALYCANKVWATAASGYSSTTLYSGRFADIDVLNKYIPQPGSTWTSSQKTTGPSDLYIQQNTWQAGGTTGWHTHPGHSLIMVTEGTVTDYEGDDPQCTPHVYSQGMTFVDEGGEHHQHIIRNETGAEAQTIAVQLMPAGSMRRIDVPNPGNCPF